MLSPHYNGGSFLFDNAIKIYLFKAKDSEIKDYGMCLGNILEDFTINNIKELQNSFLLVLILWILTIF